MQRDAPRLRTRVISDSLATCCDLLGAGAVDILLCYTHHAASPKIDEEVFHRKDLAQDRFLPVAASEAARAYGWNLNAGDAGAIPYLAYESLSFLGVVVEATIGKRPLNAETIYVDGLVETIKRRLMQGSGFAWMPETAVSDELVSGQLVAVGEPEWSTSLTISAFANPEVLEPSARDIWDRL